MRAPHRAWGCVAWCAQVDASLVSEGQDADATREYVAELVTQQMACEGFQLRPDQVRRVCTLARACVYVWYACVLWGLQARLSSPTGGVGAAMQGGAGGRGRALLGPLSS